VCSGKAPDNQKVQQTADAILVPRHLLALSAAAAAQLIARPGHSHRYQTHQLNRFLVVSKKGSILEVRSPEWFTDAEDSEHRKE
jgi:hypothetical protein